MSHAHRRRGISLFIRSCIVALPVVVASCSESTEPDETPLSVQNIALYDGAWKDAGFGASLGTTSNAVVNAIVHSPHVQNEVIVAGAFDRARSGSISVRAAGLVAFNRSGGLTALVEGDTTGFIYGGPYTSAEFVPGSPDQIIASSSIDASNENPASSSFGTIGVFDRTTRTWSKLNGGSISGVVTSLARRDRELYIGGYFSDALGVNGSANLVRYDIDTKLPLTMATLQSGGGATGISVVKIDGATVLVGGTFSVIGGVRTASIAKWDGTGWVPLAGGLTGYVRDIVVHNAMIYATGRFISGDTVNILARFDYTKWTKLDPPRVNIPATEPYEGHALAVYNGRVIVGGMFKTIGDITVNNIAAWDNPTERFVALNGGGVTHSGGKGEVNAMLGTGNGLIVGGRFDLIGR